MKTYRLISIIALAFTLMACDDINQLPQDPEEPMPGVVHFKATINTNTPSTRGLSFEGGVLNANWKVGEEIALVYGNPAVKDKATVTSVSNGRATVECDLSGGAANGSIINFYYPYASVVLSNGSYVFDETLIRNQDGTMDYISEKLDWRQATGTLSVNGNSATLQSDVDMSTCLNAIWKLSLQNLHNTLNAASFTVKVDFGIKANIIYARSTYYVALPAFKDKVVELWAGVAENPNAYLFETEGVTLKENTYYESTVQLGKVINFNRVEEDYVLQDTEVLWCQAGDLPASVYPKFSIADGATISLKEVMVSGPNDSDHNWAGLTCLGDATIVVLSGHSTVTGYYHFYPGIFVPENKTLTIKGLKSGDLTCQSQGYAPGIGSVRGSQPYSEVENPYISSGNIVIKSGNILAIGSKGSPAIGSTTKTSCGNITIEGGVVKATTEYGEGGAGIGGPFDSFSSCGNITISGGTVTAEGGEWCPGIGAGGHSTHAGEEEYHSKCGDILISGGFVTATGGEKAAGIGCGKTYSKCGNITIKSAVLRVIATKGKDALNSIGKADNDNICGTVTIEPGAMVTQN